MGRQKLNEFNGAAEPKAGNKWFHMIQRDVNHPEISVMNPPMTGYISYESFQKYEPIPRMSVDSAQINKLQLFPEVEFVFSHTLPQKSVGPHARHSLSNNFVLLDRTFSPSGRIHPCFFGKDLNFLLKTENC